MYGEGDPYYVTNGLRSAQAAGGTLHQVGPGTARFQPVYAGNTAWAFVCAGEDMYRISVILTLMLAVVFVH